MKVQNLERARKLGRRLGAQVVIDETGWLRSEVELVFERERDRTLRPVMVRVGRDASDASVTADGGVLASCHGYNGALVRLRWLASRLADLIRQGRVRLDSGAPAVYAHALLSGLDELIDRRQRLTMGHGVVQLATLRRETEFFGRYAAQLAPVVEGVDARALRRLRAWWRARDQDAIARASGGLSREETRASGGLSRGETHSEVGN